MVGRPRKDRRCSKHSVSLSPESQDIIERCGYQSNLSDFLNNLIRSAAEDSPVYLAIQIERLTKEIAALKEQVAARTVERDLLQARHNLVERRAEGVDKARHEARIEVLRLWDSCVSVNRSNPNRASVEFKDAFGGPAYSTLLRDAGFRSPDDALAWAQAEARGR